MGGDDLNAPIRMLYSKYEMVVKLLRVGGGMCS